jgi:hypothetical protein
MSAGGGGDFRAAWAGNDVICPPAPAPAALLWLAALYPVLVPFYLMGRTLVPGTQRFASGVPQIADYYLVCLMVLTFSTLPVRLAPSMRPIVAALAAFVGYSALVNGTWSAVLEDMSLMKSTLFYAYDFLLFVTCVVLYDAYRERFLKAALYGVMASVALQVMLSPIALQSTTDRQALFFNDENQLGYFCLLIATVFAMVTRRCAVSAWLQVAFFAGVAYLAILSQSRGALAALVVLGFVAVFDRPMHLIAMAGAILAVYLTLMAEPSLTGRSERRLVVAGQYDSAEGRGYDRIFNHPEHTVLGAGEGAYERFRSALYGSEIHSSYGTLLFCYGAVGLGLFGFAIFWIARANLRLALFLVPSVVYGSTHHGVRAAFFWFMLAILTILATELQRRATRREHEDAPCAV